MRIKWISALKSRGMCVACVERFQYDLMSLYKENPHHKSLRQKTTLHSSNNGNSTKIKTNHIVICNSNNENNNRSHQRIVNRKIDDATYNRFSNDTSR